MAKYIKLTAAQKDEIRRLTQFANRRIKAAEKQYKKEGMTVLPAEVVGKTQIKEQWHTKTTPLSRSVRFTSQKEYKQRLHYLRQFEHMRPTIDQYTQTQREKTSLAAETTMGVPPTKKLADKINKSNAPQLSKFWNVFSRKAAKMGVSYSSKQALIEAVHEVFGEDISFLGG